MIEAHHLTRQFGDFTAVQQVSLHVPPGTLLALLGPNGAGKTTTVRMLAGLLAPSAGSATVAGFDVQRDPAQVRARVGLVTDSPGLYEQMALYDYLDFFGTIYGLSATTRRSRVNELISFFELEEQRQKRMVDFSKGMKQKVALARALLHEPAVLFLDEPTSGLDPLATRNVRDLIVNLKHASRTIILCTHDLDEAERLADAVAILNHGRIIANDTPATLRANASPTTQVRIALAAPAALPWAALHAIDGLTMAMEQTEQPTLALTYAARQPEAVNPRVIAQLVQAGAQIVTVTCATRTLEDVYADVIEAQATASNHREAALPASAHH